MGRLSNEAKAEKARNVLIKTIASIHELEPTLGGKWRDGMLLYYQHRLAELILYQLGFHQPTKAAVLVLAAEIVATLDPIEG